MIVHRRRRRNAKAVWWFEPLVGLIVLAVLISFTSAILNNAFGVNVARGFRLFFGVE